MLHFVGHAYGHCPPYVFSAHAHNLAPYVGKGRQQAARSSELSDINALTSDAAARAGYVLYRALVLLI